MSQDSPACKKKKSSASPFGFLTILHVGTGQMHGARQLLQCLALPMKTFPTFSLTHKHSYSLWNRAYITGKKCDGICLFFFFAFCFCVTFIPLLFHEVLRVSTFFSASCISVPLSLIVTMYIHFWKCKLMLSYWVFWQYVCLKKCLS